MDLNDIEEKINKMFSNSSTKREIIFWYDEKEEFKEDIEKISLNNAELHVLKEDKLIYSKYYIEMENPEKNFLVYAPFSQPSDENNYLADMVHYAKKFTADKLVLVCQRLNIPQSFINVLEEHLKFWKAESRLKSFENLNINEFTENKIILGILAVLSNQKSINFDHIVREVIVKDLSEENKILNEFKKYNIENKFWDLVSKRFGYEDKNPTVTKLNVSLILNYTADLYEGNIPKSWESYVINDRNNSHIFIDEFMNNINYSNIYDEIANDLEKKLKINNLNKNSIDSYKHCDSFELFDKNIINYYADLIITNQVDLGSDFINLIEFRKKTHFYKKYENNYQLLKYANLFISLINEFKIDDLSDDIDEIIQDYADKWAYIDGYYRKFYFNFDKVEESEKLENLRQLIEKIYTNEFLAVINPIFTRKLAEQPLNDILIDKQWNFYKQNVPHSIKKHKTAVIISDAFRYGCAVELLSELEKDPKRKASIKPMLSSIPSITSLGMASLLPNKKITFEDKTVLVDDKKTITTEDRDKILKSYNPNSKAITYNKLNSLKQSELRETFKGIDLIYIYHNVIDLVGDKQLIQDRVFDAAHQTINDILYLISRLTNNLNLTSFIITADHGFIYKRNQLLEKDKVDVKGVELEKDKRFIISEGKLEGIDGVVSISMDYINENDIFVNIPLGTDIFKVSGGGQNYVHGGGSLEECIVPLLHVKTKTGARNQSTVELQLISTNNKVTNHEIMLTFFQKENVSKKILPLQAAISFVDENNQRISNEIIINADVNSDSAEDREFKERFTLLKKQYSKTKDYYLIIKDAIEDIEIERIPFTIDIAFQDGFDFF